MQMINVTFIFEGNAPIPNLPKCVYVRDPASSTEGSISVFYESLQIAFANNVL